MTRKPKTNTNNKRLKTENNTEEHSQPNETEMEKTMKKNTGPMKTKNTPHLG